ncbi:hypothetical protein N7455_000105 [Penicillium solitum]|uniref:uncharacterized protein n=1 Tax=Penicillium solitum TaxID=60172 RepID=UPI0017D84D22|nr:hypothetical protein HAV15_002565 [Penicillium sp. str. \
MTENISLVTGASGFIASHVVQQLLESGDRVHATIRSTKNKKIKHLLDMQERWPGKLALFEADLLMAGSFEAPMKGCSVVYHIASPFFIEKKIRDGQKEVVEPALKGTQHVLDAVKKCETVKLVVLTSSVAAIFGDNADVLEMKNKTLSSEYFNTTSSVNHNAYPYSKVTAEKEAWKLYEAQPTPPRWKLITINPGLVLGPSLSPTSESGSLSLLDQLLRGELFFGVPDMWFAIVDVREVATAHIRAAQTPDSHGRYILADSKTHGFGELARILRSITQSSKIPNNRLPNTLVRIFGPVLGLSQKWLRLNLGISFDIDNRPSLDQLNIVYRPLEETLTDHYRTWKTAQSH